MQFFDILKYLIESSKFYNFWNIFAKLNNLPTINMSMIRIITN